MRAAPATKIHPPFRERLQAVMAPYDGGPNASALSLALDIFVIVCILGSCALIPLDHFFPRHEPIFWRLEQIFTGIFVVEYLARWYSAKDRLRYPFGFYALIDLLAILPTLLMFSFSLLSLRVIRGFRFLRLLRLLRLVRLLKFVRYGHLMYRALVSFRIWCSAVNYRYRLRQLGLLTLTVFIAWLLGANMLYLTEQSLTDSPGPFDGYWKSYWNILIVLVSGIEDKEPISLLGRVEVTAMLITGIVIVGMLTGEIVAILVKKAERAGRVAIKPPRGKLARHFVVIGTNSHMDAVIREIYAATRGQNYILVVAPEAEDLPVTDPQVYRRVFALGGDPVRSEVLAQAYLGDCLRVVILAQGEPGQAAHLTDDRTLMRTIAVLGRRASKPMVVEIRDPETLEEVGALEEAGVEFILSRQYSEGLIAQAVLNPGITAVFERLLTFAEDTSEFYSVPAPSDLWGKTFTEACLSFLASDAEAIVPVGIDRSPPGRPHTKLLLNPVAGRDGIEAGDLVLREGDSLVLIAEDRPSFAVMSKEELWTGSILPRS